MVHIRINKKRKLYVYNDNKRMTNGFDIINKLGTHYLLKNIDKYGSTIDSFLFNSESLEITGPLDFSIFYNKTNLFYARKGDLYQVYREKDLVLIFETKKNEADPYNFNYLKDDLFVSNKSILKGNGELISLLNNETSVYKSGSINIFSTGIQNTYLVNHEGYFLIEEAYLQPNSIKNVFIRMKTLYIVYEDQVAIYIDNKRVFKDDVKFEDYHYVSQALNAFKLPSEFYFVLHQLFGPYKIEIFNESDRPKLIFQSPEYLVYLFSTNMIIYERLNNSMVVTPLNEEYNWEVDKNNSPVYLYLKDNKIYQLFSAASDKIFYFNPVLKKIVSLIDMYSIKPYIQNETLYYLNANFQETEINTKVQSGVLTSYSYFQDNLYYIELLANKFFVKNTLRITKELILEEEGTLDGNSNVLIKIEPKSENKSSFYTISENLSKFIKAPFKVYGIYEGSLLYPSARIDFSTQNESASKLFELTSEYPFYSTEE